MDTNLRVLRQELVDALVIARTEQVQWFKKRDFDKVKMCERDIAEMERELLAVYAAMRNLEALAHK